MIMRILVSVMTYPSLSEKHFETVCTAGFREDGSWIRIFPIPYRMIYQDNDVPRYHKWQWIEVDVEKRKQDDRPESYHINIDTLRIDKNIVGKGKEIDWNLRLQWVLKNKRVFTNMTELLELTEQNKISLAVLKPSCMKRVICCDLRKKDDGKSMEKYANKLSKLKKRYQADKRQMNIFESKQDIDASFKFAEKIPYKFSYEFVTEDEKTRTLMIEDWEIGALYRNCIQQYKNEEVAVQKVIDKYTKLAEKDIYLFLGTSYEWHKRKASNPYLIIGVFAPPKNRQLELELFPI
ncbi:hypothetical protein [Prevotella intermedia]|uniref:hypothetical protein n=1 Tax=Prevotella intermedia TaxID=28131 RepID=UPI000BE77539|nr:hypothetical protein [Prevotella intermedia]PDP68796.1 hypothetical protein CLI70_04460 [Prevotella intermedia]